MRDRTSGSLRQDAAQGVVWTVASKWGSRLLSVFVLVVLARLLSPEDFGLVALASVVTAFVALIRDQGFAQALVQRSELEAEHLDTSFWMGVGMGTVLMLVLQVFASPLAALLGESEVEPVLRWLSLTFPVAGARTTAAALLARRMEFKVLATRNMAGMVAGGVVGVSMAAAGAGVWSLVGQALTETLVQSLMLATAVKWCPRFCFSYRHFRDLFGFSINILGIQALNLVFRRGDDLLIGMVLGPRALGLYTVAYQLLRVVIELFVETISAVTLPIFSRLQHDFVRMRRATYFAIRTTALISLPAFVGLALAAHEIVLVIFGTKWEGSAAVMQVLAVGGVAMPPYILQSQLLLAAGMPRKALLLSTCNGVISLAAFAVSVQWGVLAVAIAFAARSYAVLPVAFVLTRRSFGVQIGQVLRYYGVPLVATVAMGAVVMLTDLALENLGSPVALLAVQVSVGGLVYLLVVRLLSAAMFAELVDLARPALPARFRSAHPPTGPGLQTRPAPDEDGRVPR